AQNNARRPQAQAAAPAVDPPRPRRGQTEAEELETEIASEGSGGRGEDWRAALAVEDEQLVEWQASEETVTGGDELTDRKR
nr:hypothetical protein [Myxococcota bacterium]